jgi:hypothetical protein
MISRAALQIAQSMGTAAASNEAGGSSAELQNHLRRSIDQATPEAARSERHASDSSLRELAPDAIVVLLKDCRRSELKSYAKWLWQELSMPQRQAVIKAWPQSTGYISGLRDVQARRESFHEDPFYLAAEACAELEMSNEDLRRKLGSDRKIWSKLSPMRKQSLSLGISERIALAAFSERNGGDPSLYLIELSPSDEKILAEDRGLREKLLRTGEGGGARYPSWLWTLELDDGRFQEILQRYPAASLAAAWIGDSGILEKVASRLPPKKFERMRELLESNPEIVPASRDNAVLREISDLALRALSSLHGAKDSDAVDRVAA